MGMLEQVLSESEDRVVLPDQPAGIRKRDTGSGKPTSSATVEFRLCTSI